MTGGSRLRIRILGRLDACDGDVEVDLGGRRQRAVLAVLVLARGEIVPADRIADCLWGDDLPANAGGGIAVVPGVEEHASRLVDALHPWDTGRVWPNFAPPHDTASARRAYDPATLARLTEVATRYDPLGVLQAGAYTRA